MPGSQNLGKVKEKILSVTRTPGTGAPGSIDTYTATLLSGGTFTFQVYNGTNGTSGVVTRNYPFSNDNDVSYFEIETLDDAFMQTVLEAYYVSGGVTYPARFYEYAQGTQPHEWRVLILVGNNSTGDYEWEGLYSNSGKLPGTLYIKSISDSAITVDSALSDSSVNPVQNKVVTEALYTLSHDIALEYENKVYAVGEICVHELQLYRCKTAITTAEAWTAAHWEAVTVQGLLDEKITFGAHVKDATLWAGKADLATLAEDFSSTQGAEIGGGEYIDSREITSAVDETKAARTETVSGNSVAANQLVNPNYLTGNTAAGITTSVSGNTVTVSGTASANVSRRLTGTRFIDAEQNHKYLIFGMKANSVSISLLFNAFNNGSYVTTYSPRDTGNGIIVDNSRAANQLSLELSIPSGTVVPNDFTVIPQVVDLTKDFPFDTPTSLDDPRIKSIIAGGYKPYNVGELKSSQVDSLTAYGFNLWDEEFTNQYYWANNSSGKMEKLSHADRSCSTNPIHVYAGQKISFYVPDHYQLAEYCLNVWFSDNDGNMISYSGWSRKTTVFDVPVGATKMYFTFSSNITFNHDICINVSNASLNGTYRPYREPSVIDFTEAPFSLTAEQRTLRSAGSVRDNFAFVRQTDGTYDLVKTVNVGSVDLDSLPASHIAYNNSAKAWNVLVPSGAPAKSIGSSDIPNIISNEGYEPATRANYGQDIANKIYVNAEGTLFYINNGSTTTKPTGVLDYELSTPTAETLVTGLTPAQIGLFLQRGGIISVGNPNAGYGALPYDLKLFAQVSDKAFLEGIGVRGDVGFDPQKVASMEQVKDSSATLAEDIEKGNVVPAIAKGLSTDVGNDDQTPFSFNTVGINSDVQSGLQEIRKLVAVNVVENQRASYTSLNMPNEAVKNITGTMSFNKGEIYLMCVTQDKTVDSNLRNIPVFSLPSLDALYPTFTKISGTLSILAANDQNLEAGFKYAILSVNSTVSKGIGWWVNGNNVGGTIVETNLANIIVKNLTQRYGNNDIVNAILGSDSSKHFERLIAFDPDILKTSAFNAGTFTTSKVKYLETIDYNQFDGAIKGGSYSPTTGAYDSNAGSFCSEHMMRVKGGSRIDFLSEYKTNAYAYIYEFDINKNFIKRIAYQNSGDTYFDLDVETVYIHYSVYRSESGWGTNPPTQEQAKVCFYYHWDGSRIGYEPYQRHIANLPNVEGHGILKVDGDGNVYADGDEMYPSGEGNKKRYGIVQLKDLSFSAGSQNRFATNSLTSVIKKVSHDTVVGNIRTARFTAASSATVYENLATYVVAVNTNGSVFFYVDATYYANHTVEQFLSDYGDDYLIYELAKEQELEAPAFDGNFYGDDFGTMRFLDEDGNEISGLQGIEVFYRANVAGFAESLGVRADWDPANVVVQSELTSEATARDAVDAQLREALGGTLRQLLAVRGSVDFDDTAYVRADDLNWSYNSNASFACWYTNDLASVAKFPSGSSGKPSFISTNYQEDALDNCYGNSKICLFTSSAGGTPSVFIRNGSSTEKPTGLLAYEKASE